MVVAPPTRYARSGGARIAFQLTGEGPPDVVLVAGPMSHLDLQWEDPEFRRACERFASYARLLSFDRRGTGLSDPLDRAPTLDQQMDDLDVVLEAAGMERVALFGAGEAGLCAMYAATHPDPPRRGPESSRPALPRLLVPKGSLLLDRPEITPHLQDYDRDRLTYDWQAGDPQLDRLHAELAEIVEADVAAEVDSVSTFRTLYRAVADAAGHSADPADLGDVEARLVTVTQMPGSDE